ncbi:futalosine hydrolase [Stackebrandtia nassauensis]|uniref:Futalosine hydrolase n=1 Tax=Stackebrandtia nassauensis (strain DSM 44728 / CIP 108903 / NRRL B-16338 / NBRC 102104 / LLR-40K-21) TaxID=446470 RepID=D3PZ57_STANL|nr:futalosine hydrolase [Stackebrandtia nassauensis]ADD45486.1 purine or other phosphorylase family 1 [Stackebrandtia nassauensis DSM 44728]
MKLLIVTAVDAERDAVLRGLSGTVHDVYTVGVGPAAAAAGTARLLALAEAAGTRYDGVVNAGIAGGLAGRADIGDVVVGTASISAELGVRTDDGFTPLGKLGFGSAVAECSLRLAAGVTGARGEILTLATITGSAQRVDELAESYPHALAEAMEGFGAATAAARVRLPFTEIRAISNAVGDRDASGWNWQAAFDALTKAAGELR